MGSFGIFRFGKQKGRQQRLSGEAAGWMDESFMPASL
jgi:hypothetical protein